MHIKVYIDQCLLRAFLVASVSDALVSCTGTAAGSAYSTVWSSLLAVALVAAYVRWSHLHHRVWATPNGVTFQVRSYQVRRLQILALPLPAARSGSV